MISGSDDAVHEPDASMSWRGCPRRRRPDAPRILAERIAAGREGARGAAPAPIAVLARAAAAAECRGRPQHPKGRVVPVDAHDVIAPHVADGQRQKAAGTDVSLVIDEHESVAVGDGAPRPSDEI